MSAQGPTRIPTRTDGVLVCPSCNGDYVHLDQADIAARTEDADFNNISVNARTGRVTTHGAPPAFGMDIGVGRRHRIVVAGTCELCGAVLELVFTQHKGQTFAEWVVSPRTEN